MGAGSSDSFEGGYYGGSEYASPAAEIVGGAEITENVVGSGPDVFHAGCACMKGAGFDFESPGVIGGNEDDEEIGFFDGGRGMPFKGLREYESSISSKLKKDVIVRLARALKNVGIDVNPEDDPDKIIKDMKRNIPNPSKGKTFEADAASHEKICKAIARVLNDQFTPGAIKGHEKLIDTNMNPVEICRKVGEWVHSFNVGVNTEFMAVHVSVQNAMRNILVLDAVMDRLFSNIEEKIKSAKSNDTTVATDTRLYRELYERAKQESLRQKLLLENILNISLPPALKELELAMQQDNEYQSVIKRLNIKPGSANFADSIAYTISAVGTSAAIAQKVDKAIKQLGMRINDYLESDNFQKFSKMLKDKYRKVDPGELANFIRAAETLKKYFKDKNTPEFRKVLSSLNNSGYKEDYPSRYNKSPSPSHQRRNNYSANRKYSNKYGRGDDDIDQDNDQEMPIDEDFFGGGPRHKGPGKRRKLTTGCGENILGGLVTGGCPRSGAGEDSDSDYTHGNGEYEANGGDENEDNVVDGGRLNDSDYTIDDILSLVEDRSDKSAMETRLEKIKKEKMIVIKDFVKRMADNYEELGKSVHKLGKLFGRDIPLSDLTDELRNVIVTIRDSDSSKIEFHLIGYYSDARAREQREKFINKIKRVITIVDKLVVKPEYKQFSTAFKDFKDALQEVINTIDIYSEAIRKNVSTTFDNDDLYGAGDDDNETTTGGRAHLDEFNIRSITIDYEELGPELAKGQFNLRKAISDFVYFYYISKVYKNLKNAAAEMESVGNSRYIELLGDSVAREIEKLYESRKKALEALDDAKIEKAKKINIDRERRAYHLEDKELREELRKHSTGAGVVLLNNPVAPAVDIAYHYDNTNYKIPDYPFGLKGKASDRVIISMRDGLITDEEDSDESNLVIINIEDISPQVPTLVNHPAGNPIQEAARGLGKAYLYLNNNKIEGVDGDVAPAGDTSGTYLRDALAGRHQIEQLKTILNPQTFAKFCLTAYIYNELRGALAGTVIQANASSRISLIVPPLHPYLKYDTKQESGFKSNIIEIDAANNAKINTLRIYIRNRCGDRALSDLGISPLIQFQENELALENIINNISVCYDKCLLFLHELGIDDNEKFSNNIKNISKGSNVIIGGDENYDYLSTIIDENLHMNQDKNMNSHIQEIKKFIEKDFEVKINFYKVVQAIDIYLKEFTVSIAKNPESIKNISKILDGTQVIANWFNDDTGENLWKAFEHMGAAEIKRVTPGLNFVGDSGSRDRYKREPVMDENTYIQQIHQIVTIYHYPLYNDKDDVFALKGKEKQHYYDILYKKIKEVQKADNEHFDEDTIGNDVDQQQRVDTKSQKIVSDPFIGVPCYNKSDDKNKYKLSKKYLDKSIDGFQALKNLLNAFFRIGDEFGGVELRRKTFMSPTQIYKYLIEYIKHSSYFMNYGEKEGIPGTKVSTLVPEYFVSFSSAYDQEISNYHTENKLFSAIVKSMSAKILVVLGIYDMFDRRQKINHLNPIRVIIGGDEQDNNVDGGSGKLDKLSVIPAAAELYFRLPRILEFYKKLLYWKGDNTELQKKVSIIPELTGVFSGLVNVIFQKVYSPETGSYSDYDAKLIIHEINYIYNFYKNSPCSEGINTKIILDLVKEINQRIGVIKKEDMNKYWELQRKLQSTAGINKSVAATTNYSILPDEGDTETDGLAPHERYLYRNKDKTAMKKKENIREIDRANNISIISEFRTKLEKIFNDYKPKDDTIFTQLSYIKLINTAEVEMKRLHSPTDKLNTAIKLIQTTKELNILADKAFMFHETVITGLNSLGAIYEMIIKFKNVMESIDPVVIEQDIINHFGDGNALDGDDNDLANSIKNIRDNIYKRNLVYKRAVTRNGAPIYDKDCNIIPPEFLSERMLIEDGQDAVAVDSIMALLDDIRFYQYSDKYNTNKKLHDDKDYTAEKIKQMYAEREFPSFNRSRVKCKDNYPNILEDDSAHNLFTRLRIVARYLVNYPYIMRLYIENLFGFVNGELITLRVVNDSSTPIQLDFSNLINVVESLIDDTKFYLNKFRPFLNDNLLDTFENVDKPGTIYWFEKKFVDEMFKGLGKEVDEKKVLVDDWDKESLSRLTKITNNVFINLIRDTKVALNNKFAYGYMYHISDISGYMHIGQLKNAKPIDDTINDLIKYSLDKKSDMKFTRESYGNLLSELIYYNNTSYKPGTENDCVEFPTNYTYYGPIYRHVDKEVNGSRRHARVENGIEKFLINGRVLETTKKDKNDSAFKHPCLNYSGRYHIWDKHDITELKSLLFSFNQLFAMYLSSCVDNMNNKIYGNLVTSFANGTGSKSVHNPDTGAYPDLTTYKHPFGRRGDPGYGSVLVSSLAHIVLRIISDNNTKTQNPDFIIGTLAEVPSYMKEKYRSNLHYLSKLFETLVSKCEFFKNIMRTRINLARTSQVLKNETSVQGTEIVIKVTKRSNMVDNRKVIHTAGDVIDKINEDQIDSICTLDTKSLAAEETRVRISQIIESIVEHTVSVKSMITEVLQELGGENPRYMETSANFIEGYKQRYNKYPLMPISNSLYFIKENICYQASKNMVKNTKNNDITFPITLGLTLAKNKFKNTNDSSKLIEMAEILDIHIKSTAEYIKEAVETSDFYNFAASVINKMCGTGYQSTSNDANFFLPDNKGLYRLRPGEKKAAIKCILRGLDAATGNNDWHNMPTRIENEEYVYNKAIVMEDIFPELENTSTGPFTSSNITTTTSGIQKIDYAAVNLNAMKAAKHSFMTNRVDVVYNLDFNETRFGKTEAEQMFDDVCFGGCDIKKLNSYVSNMSIMSIYTVLNSIKQGKSLSIINYSLKAIRYLYCISAIIVEKIRVNSPAGAPIKDTMNRFINLGKDYTELFVNSLFCSSPFMLNNEYKSQVLHIDELDIQYDLNEIIRTLDDNGGTYKNHIPVYNNGGAWVRTVDNVNVTYNSINVTNGIIINTALAVLIDFNDAVHIRKYLDGEGSLNATMVQYKDIIDNIKNDPRFNTIDKALYDNKDFKEILFKFNPLFNYLYKTRSLVMYTVNDLYNWLYLSAINYSKLPTIDISELKGDLDDFRDYVGFDDLIDRYYASGNAMLLNIPSEYILITKIVEGHANANDDVFEYYNNYLTDDISNFEMLSIKPVCVHQFYLHSRNIQKKIIESHILSKTNLSVNKDSLWDDSYLLSDNSINELNDATSQPFIRSLYRHIVGGANENQIIDLPAGTKKYNIPSLRLNNESNAYVNNPFMDKLYTYLNYPAFCEKDCNYVNNSKTSYLCPTQYSGEFSFIDTLRYVKSLKASENFERNIKKTAERIDKYKNYTYTINVGPAGAVISTQFNDFLFGTTQFYMPRIYYNIMQDIINKLNLTDIYKDAFNVTRRILTNVSFIVNTLEGILDISGNVGGADTLIDNITITMIDADVDNIVNDPVLIAAIAAAAAVPGTPQPPGTLTPAQGIVEKEYRKSHYLLYNAYSHSISNFTIDKLKKLLERVRDNVEKVFKDQLKPTTDANLEHLWSPDPGRHSYIYNMTDTATNGCNVLSRNMFPEVMCLYNSILIILNTDNNFMTEKDNIILKILMLSRLYKDITDLVTKGIFDMFVQDEKSNEANVGPNDIETNPYRVIDLINTDIHSSTRHAVLKNFLFLGLAFLNAFKRKIIDQSYDNTGNRNNSSLLYTMKSDEDFLTYLMISNYFKERRTREENVSLIRMNSLISSVFDKSIKSVNENIPIIDRADPVFTGITSIKAVGAQFGITEFLDPLLVLDGHDNKIATHIIALRLYEFGGGVNNRENSLKFIYNCVTLYMNRLDISNEHNEIFKSIGNSMKKLNDLKVSTKIDEYSKKFNDIITGIYECVYDREKFKEQKTANNTPETKYKVRCSTEKDFFKFLEKDVLEACKKPSDSERYEDVFQLLTSLIVDIDEGNKNRIFYTQDHLMKTNNLFGSVDTKLQYGLRPIVISGDVSYDTYPSIKEFITRFNETVMTTSNIELDKYLEFMKKIVSIVRYNLDCRNFKSYVQSDYWTGIELNNVQFDESDKRPHPLLVTNFTRPPVRDTGLSNFVRVLGTEYITEGANSIDKKMIAYPFQADQRAYNIIFSVESTNQEEEINKIIKDITDSKDEGDSARMSECINNLLDLNLMPININILMTDVPLINLYNYEYTFELMTSAMYGKDHSRFKALNTLKAPRDTQEAFLTLLFHPYIDLHTNSVNGSTNFMYLGDSDLVSSYYEYINRIMRGDNNLGLGRPKFLSDQVFNKVLLRSIYPSAYTEDEAGPTASVNLWKGYNRYSNKTRFSNNLTDIGTLTYPYIDDKKKNFEIRSVTFDPTTAMYLDHIGRKRFDTTIIRNLFLIVNVLRITRLKLNKELSTDRNVVVNSHYAVSSNLTEYGNYPFNPNEEYDSQTVEGEDRFDTGRSNDKL